MSTFWWIVLGMVAWFLISIPFGMLIGAMIRLGEECHFDSVKNRIGYDPREVHESLDHDHVPR